MILLSTPLSLGFACYAVKAATDRPFAIVALGISAFSALGLLTVMVMSAF